MNHPIKRCPRILIGVAALAVALGGGSTVAAPAGAAGPAQLVLRAGDVPKNFVLVGAQALSLAHAAKGAGMSAAQLRAAGYITGYTTEYERKGVAQATRASQVRGLILAGSDVLQFRRAAGAHAAFLGALRAVPRQLGVKGFALRRLPPAGNESQGYVYHESAGGVPLTFDFELFRRGTFVALVGGGGGSMTLGTEDSIATHLAAIVDARIAANR